jgi:hypothetical protein
MPDTGGPQCSGGLPSCRGRRRRRMEREVDRRNGQFQIRPQRDDGPAEPQDCQDLALIAGPDGEGPTAGGRTPFSLPRCETQAGLWRLPSQHLVIGVITARDGGTFWGAARTSGRSPGLAVIDQGGLVAGCQQPQRTGSPPGSAPASSPNRPGSAQPGTTAAMVASGANVSSCDPL